MTTTGCIPTLKSQTTPNATSGPHPSVPVPADTTPQDASVR